MDIISRIFKALGEIARLARTLFTNGVHFIALCARSRTALAAENLFLRKQLAFYQERKVAPRRFDNVSRFILVLLSRVFAWKDALVNVTPKTFIGWHRQGFRLFWRWKSRLGRPPKPPLMEPLSEDEFEQLDDLLLSDDLPKRAWSPSPSKGFPRRSR